MSPRTWKIQGILHAVGVAVATGYLLWIVRGAAIDLSQSPVSFDLARGVAAVLLLVTIYVALAGLWLVVARELGESFPFANVLRLWSVSNAARYIPGKIWQILGLVSTAKSLDISPGVATAVAALAFGFMISTGALVGWICAPEALQGHAKLTLAVQLVSAGLLVPLAFPGAIPALLGRLPRFLGTPISRPLPRFAVLRLTLWFLAVWLVHGAAFSFFATCFAGPPRDLRLDVGCFALAYVSGLIAVFAPGGLGVREGALAALLLRTGTETVPAHALAVAARLWTSAAEVLLLLGVLAWGARPRPRREPN